MQPLIIKCGGSVFEQLPASFYEDVVNIKKSGKWQPMIVHGGGPLISTLLDKMDISTHFVDGLRVTTEEVLDVVEMVLSGMVNKQVVRRLNQFGGQAWGLSGVDGPLLEAQPQEQVERLGYVGHVANVKESILRKLFQLGHIPVISPLGIDRKGQRYNINADVAASAIAQSLQGKLCFISDIPGIYREEGDPSSVLGRVTKKEAEELISDHIVTGGMIPKVQAAVEALEQGVSEVAIFNGLQEHRLLDYCAGKNVGTRFVKQEEIQHV